MSKSVLYFKDATFKHGVFDVLKNVTFNIAQGDRVAIVGVNGAGKSSLLKYIVDSKQSGMELTSGSVEIQKDIRIQYVPQVATDVIEEQLSGGEKTKKILQNIFKDIHTTGEDTLYIFDEPTNNLDTEGLGWLYKTIESLPKKDTVLVVSHDRDFLDTIANKICEIDEYSRSIRMYSCTYSEYREIRKKEIEDQWKEYSEKQETIKKLEKDMERKNEWQKKIEQTRANNRKLDPNEKEKPVAAYLRDKEGKMGKRTKVAKDRMERFDTAVGVEKPKVRLPINLHFDEVLRSGEKVLVCRDALFTYNQEETIGPFNLSIAFGDKVHITGKNGSGKTTLVKGILGMLKPVSGEMMLGTNIHIGYLPQEEVLESFKNTKDIIDTICAVFNVHRDNETEGNFRMTLKRFGFDDPDARKHITELSSGERSRLQLAIMYLMKPNCIVLDEPTNHLDIEAVEALENAISKYEGTLILISHDTRFVEKVGITKTIAL